VRVAAGDINGDGFDDIITAAGRRRPAHQGVRRRDGCEIRSFFAYDPGYSFGRTGGRDVNGDGYADIITALGAAARTSRCWTV